MKAVFIFTWIRLKSFFRDPVSLLFTFALPVVFLLVFGALFSNDSAVNFDVAVINHSKTEFSQEFVKNIDGEKTFTTVAVDTIAEAKEKMSRGQIDTIIELPTPFGEVNSNGRPTGQMTVYYEKNSPETGQTIAQIMSSVTNDLGLRFGQEPPLFSVQQKATDTTAVSQFDYMFAGLLSFSVLSLGFFGLAQMIPGWKKTGALRRIKATPLKKGQLIAGTMLTFVAIGIAVLIVMFIVGMTVFGFNMRGDWLQLIPFLVLGTVTVMGFGLLIGGAMKNENQAAALTNLVAFPMMFLSGMFFPSYLMPDWVQSVSNFMPLTPLVDGVRLIITENATLIDVAPQIGLLSIWLIVVYVGAVKLFRWE